MILHQKKYCESKETINFYNSILCFTDSDLQQSLKSHQSMYMTL